MLLELLTKIGATKVEITDLQFYLATGIFTRNLIITVPYECSGDMVPRLEEAYAAIEERLNNATDT